MRPKGPSAQAQLLAAEACGADQAFFLVNGTTCGIEALLLATAGPGQTVLLPAQRPQISPDGTDFDRAQSQSMSCRSCQKQDVWEEFRLLP